MVLAIVPMTASIGLAGTPDDECPTARPATQLPSPPMDDHQLHERLALIEHQLRAISAHLGMPYPAPGAPGSAPGGPPPGWGGAGGDPGLTPEVVQLARSGNLIGAIKQYREITGVSLADAKAAVERIG